MTVRCTAVWQFSHLIQSVFNRILNMTAGPSVYKTSPSTLVTSSNHPETTTSSLSTSLPHHRNTSQLAAATNLYYPPLTHTRLIRTPCPPRASPRNPLTAKKTSAVPLPHMAVSSSNPIVRSGTRRSHPSSLTQSSPTQSTIKPSLLYFSLPLDCAFLIHLLH